MLAPSALDGDGAELVGGTAVDTRHAMSLAAVPRAPFLVGEKAAGRASGGARPVTRRAVDEEFGARYGGWRGGGRHAPWPGLAGGRPGVAGARAVQRPGLTSCLRCRRRSGRRRCRRRPGSAVPIFTTPWAPAALSAASSTSETSADLGAQPGDAALDLFDVVDTAEPGDDLLSLAGHIHSRCLDRQRYPE